jgi:acyl-CoA thioester hydrolase
VTDERFALEIVAGTEDARDSGHVDHAVFANYVARVREAFLRATVPGFEHYERPVVTLELEYRAELFPGDRVTGTIEVAAVGETSLTTLVTLSQDGEPVATGRTVQVVVDPETGEPTRVPEDWRAVLR